MAITRARKIAQRGSRVVKTNTILPTGVLNQASVKAYTAITNLPVSGNSIGDIGFVFKDKDGNFGYEKLYIWVGNSETDYGGWYHLPIGAAA